MLGGMQEDDGLIWAMYGTTNPGRRERALRTLRRQYASDLTDARAEVIALKHRLRLIDNALLDYMLGGKQEAP
ncbi:MAG TPA: hypothetical protein VGO52_14690 [Hyphomonadaceae bacterium]|jgi:hypothetical protein|nr:hypothetical protein [Hyphomonadaceae bacterium]